MEGLINYVLDLPVFWGSLIAILAGLCLVALLAAFCALLGLLTDFIVGALRRDL